MGLRTWVEEAPASRSILLGAAAGAWMYFVPYGLPVTIMVATAMHSVYFSFAFICDETPAMLQETFVLGALCYFYFVVCLGRVDEKPLYAPLAIFVHGIMDWIHHFRLAPVTSNHVKTCCEHYPIICGCFDVAFAAVMSLLIAIFG